MITQNRISCFTLLFLWSIIVSAQTWNDIPNEDKTKIQVKWFKLTHSARVVKTDSTASLGQILFPTDSGIVWRSAPQYLPYEENNIELIPYRNIREIQTNQQSRLGRHIMNGGMIGAALFLTVSYQDRYIFYTENPSQWVGYTSIGFLTGLGAGLVSGLFIDKIRSQRSIENPDFKTIRRVGSLYPFKKRDFWRKHWIENDSLIAGYSLPPTIDKVRPLYDFQKWEVSARLNIDTDLDFNLDIQNGSVNQYGDGYYLNPRAVEFRLSYRLRPWLTLGLLTHKTQTEGNYLRIYLQDTDLEQYNDGSVRSSFQRTLGAFVEYTPFPVKYIAMRRWEVKLGAGMMYQAGSMHIFQAFNYRTPDLSINDEFNLSETLEFRTSVGMAYIGTRFYLTRSFGFEAQFGRYEAIPQQFAPIHIDFIDPYPDMSLQLRDLNISRNNLSFATFIRF